MIGILLWGVLIGGSALALLLVLPDIVYWIMDLNSRLKVDRGRERLSLSANHPISKRARRGHAR